VYITDATLLTAQKHACLLLRPIRNDRLADLLKKSWKSSWTRFRVRSAIADRWLTDTQLHWPAAVADVCDGSRHAGSRWTGEARRLQQAVTKWLKSTSVRLGRVRRVWHLAARLLPAAAPSLLLPCLLLLITTTQHGDSWLQRQVHYIASTPRC